MTLPTHTINNPAGRLLSLVLKAKHIKGSLGMLGGWAELLGVRDTDKSRLLQEIGRVFSLVPTIKRKIERKDVDHGVHLKWIPKIEEAFATAMNPGTMWREFAARLDETVIYGLEICNSTLLRVDPEAVALLDDLDELQKLVEHLADELDQSDIPEPTRSFLMRHLDAIHGAIQGARIHGLEPLRQAVEAVIGSSVLSPETATATTETEIGERFWKIVQRATWLCAITTFATQLPEHIGNVLRLLPQD